MAKLSTRSPRSPSGFALALPISSAMSFCPPLFDAPGGAAHQPLSPAPAANGPAPAAASFGFASEARPNGPAPAAASFGFASEARPNGPATGRSATRRLRYHNKHHTIFVTRLPPDADERTLADAFSPFGFVVGVYVERNERGDSMNYAFVELDSEQGAAAAVREMDRRLLKGPEPQVAARCVTVDFVRGSRAANLLGANGTGGNPGPPVAAAAPPLRRSPEPSPSDKPPTLSPYTRAAAAVPEPGSMHAMPMPPPAQPPQPHVKGPPGPHDGYGARPGPHDHHGGYGGYRGPPEPYGGGRPGPYDRYGGYGRAPDPYDRAPEPHYGGRPGPYDGYGGRSGPYDRHGGYERAPEPHYGGRPGPYERYGGYGRAPDPYDRAPEPHYGGRPGPHDGYGGRPEPYDRHGGNGRAPDPYARAPEPHYGGRPGPHDGYGGRPGPHDRYGGYGRAPDPYERAPEPHYGDHRPAAGNYDHPPAAQDGYGGPPAAQDGYGGGYGGPPAARDGPEPYDPCSPGMDDGMPASKANVSRRPDSPPYSPNTPPPPPDAAAQPPVPIPNALSLLASMLRSAGEDGRPTRPRRNDETAEKSEAIPQESAEVAAGPPSPADEEGVAMPDLSPTAWRQHLGVLPKELVVIDECEGHEGED
jgi:hypothetical protein